MQKKSVRSIFIFLLLFVFFVGCSTMSVNPGPTFKKWEGAEGDYRHFVSTDFIETNAFAPSTSSNMMLECKRSPSMGDPENLIDQECRYVSVGNHSAGSGVMPSVGSALIQSSGVVGAAYLLGEGLAKSGDRSSTKNSNSASGGVSSSESASAGGAGGAGGTGIGEDESKIINYENETCYVQAFIDNVWMERKQVSC